MTLPCDEVVHRAPVGPDEDVINCPHCWRPTFAKRPLAECQHQWLAHPVEVLLLCRRGSIRAMDRQWYRGSSHDR